MLGFVSGEEQLNPGRLIRWRCAWQREYGIDAEKGLLLGRPVLFVRHMQIEGLAPSRRRRRLDYLAGVLRRNGVDKAAYSAKFSGREYLADSRVCQMNSRYLHTYLAGDVGAFVAERSGGTAVCFSRTVGKNEERAILKLAGAFRYLMIVSDRDGENVCKNLRKRYGLPVVESPTVSQLRRADFALLFTPPKKEVELGRGCLAFAPEQELYSQIGGGQAICGLKLKVPEEISAALPERFMPDPILSELALAGQIDPGKIKISGLSLDKPEDNDYNTIRIL